MSEAKSVECLSYYATAIGLTYIVVGLLSGLYMVYLLMSENEIPSMMASTHSHFLYMSILIVILGMAMSGWASLIAERRFTLTGGLLRSAQASVALLALGAIITFVFYLAQVPQVGLVGYALYFIGFLVAAVGWVLGGRKAK